MNTLTIETATQFTVQYCHVLYGDEAGDYLFNRYRDHLFDYHGLAWTLGKKCILVDDIDEYFRTSKGWQTIRKILRTKNTNENALYDAENYYLEHKQELDFPLIWNNYDCFDLALEYFEDSVSFKKERQCDINSLGEKRITSLSAIPAKDIENKESCG